MTFTEEYTNMKSKVKQIVKSVRPSKLRSQKKEGLLPYAYPCDNYIDSILSNGLVRKTLQFIDDKYCREQIHRMILTGHLVEKNNYPRVYDILQDCLKSLNVVECPEFYISSQLKGINAISVGTDNFPIIFISRKAAISLPDGELKFVIGHELGHVLQKNLMCHTIKGLLDNVNDKSNILGPIVSDLIEVPLNQWYRCAEYTADRAGFTCSPNISYVKSLFAKLDNNSTKGESQIANYFELSNIHPTYINRLKLLEQFMLTKVSTN